MTDLADRTAVATAPQAPYGRRATLTAAMASAAWAAIMGLVVCTVVVMASWAASGGSAGAASALRVAAATWLLSQHVGLTVGSSPSFHLGLVPLGLLLVPAVLLYRAGGSVARVVGLRGWRESWLAIGGMAAAYAAIAGVVAGMTTSVAVRPAPLQSLLVPWALAMACGGAGALRQDRLGRRLLRRLPATVAVCLRAGVVAVWASWPFGAVRRGADAARAPQPRDHPRSVAARGYGRRRRAAAAQRRVPADSGRVGGGVRRRHRLLARRRHRRRRRSRTTSARCPTCRSWRPPPVARARAGRRC